MKVQHSVVIRRPLPEVFAFVTDLRNEIRWQPEIESVVLDGPMGEGARFRERRRSFGLSFDWRFRVTRYEPLRCVAIETLRSEQHWAPYRGARYFEAVAGGTRVIEEGELELPGVMRPFEPVFARMSKRPLRVAYGRLATLLEGDDAQRRAGATLRVAHCMLEPFG